MNVHPRARPSLRLFATTLVALACLASSPIASRAVAQDDTSVEDRARIEDLVRSLNNPTIRRMPSELRDRIGRLVSSRHPLAVSRLREILRDTGANAVVVEQLITTILVDLDPNALALIDDVIERFRIEQDSAFARRFDEPLLRYANTELVTRIAVLATDAERAEGFREAALTTLGRTGHADALRTLLAIWSGEDTDLRLAASRAFVRIVPFVESVDDAADVVRQMEERQLPLTEVLRRRLRDASSTPAVPPGTTFETEYRELAEAALERLPLADVIARLLASPLPELRSAAAARLAAFPYGDDPDPAGARIGAAKALLATLGAEETEAVESAVLVALLPLAPAVRENVDDRDMDALERRVVGTGRASRAVRVAAIDLLTALRDPRPVPLLAEEFDSLGDTDPDLRIELLDALAACNGDLTGWLRERVLDEPHVRVLRRMVVQLGKDPDPAAVETFEELLARRAPDGARAYDDLARSYVVQALGQLWTLRGSERARDLLIEHGLVDPLVAVRETSASALAGVIPGRDDRSASIAALESVLTGGDQELKVRLVAARGILDLSPLDALTRLGDALLREEIWAVFRARRVEDLRGGHVDVDDVLRDAQALWDAGDARRPLSLELLRAVAEAGTGLWEGESGRGVVRETLAERLLASGQPSVACTFAEALVADPPRDGDPRHRWRLLLGRSLRACGQGDRLSRAVTELTALQADSALPAALRSRVGLELGDALLQSDDPTAALAVFGTVDAASDTLAESDRTRLETSRAAAAQASAEEGRQVLLLAASVADDPEARERLVALGHRAARHLLTALGGASDPATVRPPLAAAALLVGESFEIPADATPEGVLAVTARAREALARFVSQAGTRGSR